MLCSTVALSGREPCTAVPSCAASRRTTRSDLSCDSRGLEGVFSYISVAGLYRDDHVWIQNGTGNLAQSGNIFAGFKSSGFHSRHLGYFMERSGVFFPGGVRGEILVAPRNIFLPSSVEVLKTPTATADEIPRCSSIMGRLWSSSGFPSLPRWTGSQRTPALFHGVYL